MANKDPLRSPGPGVSAETLRRLNAVARSAALGAFSITRQPSDNATDELRRRIASSEHVLRRTQEATARTEADRRTLSQILALLDHATVLASGGGSGPRLSAALALEMAQSHVAAGLADTDRLLADLRNTVRNLETSTQNGLAAASVNRPGAASRSGTGIPPESGIRGTFERDGNVLRYTLRISGKVPPGAADKGGETNII